MDSCGVEFPVRLEEAEGPGKPELRHGVTSFGMLMEAVYKNSAGPPFANVRHISAILDFGGAAFRQSLAMLYQA